MNFNHIKSTITLRYYSTNFSLKLNYIKSG